MSKILQLFLILGSISLFIIVIYNVRKNNMYNRYSIIWIIWSLILIIVSVFPSIIYFISNVIGFEKPVNAIFAITIFSLLCFVFYLYKKISKQNEEIIKLNYEISKIKHKSTK